MCVHSAALKKIIAPLNVLDECDDESQLVVAKVLENLQPLITAANIGKSVLLIPKNSFKFKAVFLAVDECDFGNSIELGTALFCSGSRRLHAIALQLLVTGYSMFNRPQFIAIVKVSFFIFAASNQNCKYVFFCRPIWSNVNAVMISVFCYKKKIKLFFKYSLYFDLLCVWL